MARTTRKSRRARYKRSATHQVARRINSIVIGALGTVVTLGIIGACADEPPAQDVPPVIIQGTTDIPLPTEINVGRQDEERTVTILEDGYDDQDEGRRVMTQEDFPCNEDEALVYHPSFGPDHVGCINHEDID